LIIIDFLIYLSSSKLRRQRFRSAQTPKTPQPEFDNRSLDQPVDNVTVITVETEKSNEKDVTVRKIELTPMNFKRKKSVRLDKNLPKPLEVTDQRTQKEDTPDPAFMTLPRSTLSKGMESVQYRTLERKKNPFKSQDSANLYKDPLQGEISGFSSLSADSNVCEIDYMSYNVGTLRVGDSAGTRIGTLNF